MYLSKGENRYYKKIVMRVKYFYFYILNIPRYFCTFLGQVRQGKCC